MAWVQTGNIRGPQGPQGVQGPAGPAGEDGKGISIAGSAATYAALPTGLGPADAGKGYLVDAGILRPDQTLTMEEVDIRERPDLGLQRNELAEVEE